MCDSAAVSVESAIAKISFQIDFMARSLRRALVELERAEVADRDFLSASLASQVTMLGNVADIVESIESFD